MKIKQLNQKNYTVLVSATQNEELVHVILVFFRKDLVITFISRHRDLERWETLQGSRVRGCEDHFA